MEFFCLVLKLKVCRKEQTGSIVVQIIIQGYSNVFAMNKLWLKWHKTICGLLQLYLRIPF